LFQKATVKISLEEPKKKFLQMITFLRNYGTTEVHLIHVRTRTSFRQHEEVEKQLEAISQDIRELGFTVHWQLRNGHAPAVIINVAEAQHTDYVAIYWKRKALLRQAVLGSIDSDILRMSNLPVFIYNPKLFKPVVKLESVLYATDFKYTDAVVMPYLISSHFKARTLYLLHVGRRAPDPATEAQRQQRMIRNLQHLANECAHAYDHVNVIETIGIVHREIIKQARASGVELIIVGKSENPDGISRLIGSTAEILPHHAPCSIFIIPGICHLPPSEYNAIEEDRS
jgi:nucleotide-binding universal stress UspA family protein